MKRKPTIRDVAKKAGVSLSTISLVLNNKVNVSDATRQKVQRVIAELGYHPQRSARGLASQASGNLGFILTEDHFSQAEPFYTRVFLGTEFEARHHDYYVLLTTVGKVLRESEIPRFLLEHNVDGVIVAGKIGSGWIEHIVGRNLPVVLIDYEMPRLRVSSVGIDNRNGARLVVNHLRNLGHTKIGFVGGDLEHPSIAARYAAYREIVAGTNGDFNEEWVSAAEPNTTSDDGYNAAQKLFSAIGTRPTALFAANDAMAIGCMRFCRDAGVRIPEDVALVGFDNVEAGLHVEPQLTTVNVHREDLGTLAVRRLVEMIHDNSKAITHTVTPVELVVRQSCGTPAVTPVAD